jgi:hypothetical protein
MSIAELTAVIRKEPGTACGFTLIRNSCTVNKVVDTVSVGDQLRPGDHIICINDIEVDESSIRDVLRNCRDLEVVHVTVARTAFHTQRFEEQARILGIASPVNAHRSGGGFFCFPGLFGKKKKKNPNSGKENIPARRQSSSAGSYSAQGFGSVTSVSSTGMRTVDLRKLQKEGAGSMWKASRESSAHN